MHVRFEHVGVLNSACRQHVALVVAIVVVFAFDLQNLLSNDKTQLTKPRLQSSILHVARACCICMLHVHVAGACSECRASHCVDSLE